MSQTRPEALLFDVGNVVVEIDFKRVLAYWATHSGVPAEALHARFGFDAAYERHERGELSGQAYFAALRQSLGIELSDAHFETGWNAVFVDSLAGIEALLADAGQRFPLYAFSNTNAVHYREWWGRFAPLFEAFDEVFVSNDIGLRKPELAAYRHVAEAIGVPSERILFFDDSQANVDGARAAGMQAVLVRSLDDVRGALAQI